VDPSLGGAYVWRILENVIGKRGLPEAIVVDIAKHQIDLAP